MNDDEYLPCEWPKCINEAVHNIHYEDEKIRVCGVHRTAVTVNIQSTGKIWSFKKPDHVLAEETIVRPGASEPLRKGAPIRRAAAQTRDWQQDAAKKADSLAQPVGEDDASRMLDSFMKQPKPRKQR